MIYISPREDTRALIADGPVMSNLPADALTSNDPRVVAESWEMPLIRAKAKELHALQQNADLALGHIERYVRPPGRLLDYGCGAGFFLRAAVKRGWEPYGLEPLVGHAVYARFMSGARVLADTLWEDAFEQDSFDVVTAFQVFEHLPDPSDELDKLWRLLKPGGLLLIEVPNIETWSVRLMRSRHRHFVQDHLSFFSQKTLGAFVQRHGFEPLETYRPIRHMTLTHLCVEWGGRLLGSRAGAYAEMLVHKCHAESRIVSVDLGDIVAIVAQKK
jgi:2-polyprenyl-3-methyl-5-hydroxy-6-metoxy-1,4-benzoquinol methylase